MDNLIFEQVWKDANLIDLKITGTSEYVQIYQNCYVDEEELRDIGKNISEYTYDYNNECYVEFGCKEGNCTPAFSMKILPAESSGRMKLELDFEIADNNKRQHRACFFIQSELGLLDKLGKSLKSMSEGKLEKCTLHEE